MILDDVMILALTNEPRVGRPRSVRCPPGAAAPECGELRSPTLPLSDVNFWPARPGPPEYHHWRNACEFSFNDGDSLIGRSPDPVIDDRVDGVRPYLEVCFGQLQETCKQALPQLRDDAAGASSAVDNEDDGCSHDAFLRLRPCVRF